MSITLRGFLRAPALYPVAATYTAGVTAICLIVAGVVAVLPGIGGFAIAAVLIVLSTMHRDVADLQSSIGVVHELVNSQRTALVQRIDTLIAVLTAAGLAIPPDPSQPKTVKAEQEVHRDI